MDANMDLFVAAQLVACKIFRGCWCGESFGKGANCFLVRSLIEMLWCNIRCED
jgi:hypothetical protein